MKFALETFPIVKSKEVEKHGTYRTKEMILERYRAMASGPKLTTAQIDALKAMAYVVALLRAFKKRVETTTLQTGLALMANDPLRKAYLTGSTIQSRRKGRRHSTLIDWMPTAVSHLLASDAIVQESHEGLPFYREGSGFDLSGLEHYLRKAEEAIQIIRKLGEKKAPADVEECIDDPAELVPI